MSTIQGLLSMCRFINVCFYSFDMYYEVTSWWRDAHSSISPVAAVE